MVAPLTETQAKLARTRGGFAVRKAPPLAGTLRERVMKLLALEPIHRGNLARLLNERCRNVDRIIRSMRAAGEIVVIGTVADLGGVNGVRRDAQVYALPGTPRLTTTTWRANGAAVHGNGEFLLAAPVRIGRGLAGWGRW